MGTRMFRRPKKKPDPKRAPLAPNRKLEPRAASEVKAGEKRRIRTIVSGAGRIVLALALTAGVILLAVAAYRHARTSDYFRVTDLDLRGNRKLDEAEVMSFLGLDAPQNIFRVDLSRLARKLQSHNWIADAVVRRSLPRRLIVEIVEREAAALVMFDVPYLVDTKGEVFKRWTIDDPAPAPVITGMSREQITEDPAAVARRIQDALDFAHRYREAGIEKTAPLHELHCEADGGFSLTAGGDPFYVEFGQGPYRLKLKRLGVLLGRMRREGHRPLHIYFDNELRPSRITVKTKSEDAAHVKSERSSNNEKRVSKI